MSKAILVMDIPKRCRECDLCNEFGICGKRNTFIKNRFEERSGECPLNFINPNLIKAIRCLASHDEYNNCYVNIYNRERGDNPEMSCKGILNTIPCPYSQEDYNTDFGSDECRKWLGELADMLDGCE